MLLGHVHCACIPFLFGHSFMEEKVDRLSELTAQGLQKMEDSAQQNNRCLLG